MSWNRQQHHTANPDEVKQRNVKAMAEVRAVVAEYEKKKQSALLIDDEDGKPPSGPKPTHKKTGKGDSVRGWSPTCKGEPRVLLDEGHYFAACVGAGRFYDKRFKREVAVLRFTILEDPHIGKTVERYFNATEKVGRGSQYFREWTLTNGGPPRRRERMPLCRFLNRIYKIEVKTVVQDWQARPLPSPLQYSRVAGILEVAVADPGGKVSSTVSNSMNTHTDRGALPGVGNGDGDGGE